MRIGELSEATGASVRSLRYYEERGLLTSTRTSGGQRVYSPDTAARVVEIQRLLRAGISSTVIADVLPCVLDPASRTGALPERLAIERARIDAQIRDLQATRDALDLVVTEVS